MKFKSKENILKIFSTSDYEKKQFKIYKTETTGKIKLKKSSINILEKYLNSLCTFDFDVATKFIAAVLSIVEGEQYQKTDLEFNYIELNAPLFITTKITLLEEKTWEDICFISTKENTELICGMHNKGKLRGSSHICKSIKDNKYILLDRNNIYTMFNYVEREVPKELTEKYPYLSEIIIDLINLRLSNKQLTDFQAISIILHQIPEKYSQLIGNKRRK